MIWKAIAAVLIAVFGWHLYAMSVVRHDVVTKIGRDTAQSGRVEVSIHPLTNVVSLEIPGPKEISEAAKDNPFAALGEALGNALGGAVAKAMEPAIEREMNTRARELFDVYAMMLAYRVKIVVGEKGERT